MDKRLRRAGLTLLWAALTAAHQIYAQGPIKAKYEHWWLPDADTVMAGEVDSIFMVILWITCITFVLVSVVMIYFLIRYRYNPNRRATYYHGNDKLEIAWTIAPALILVFLAVLSKNVWSEMKQDMPAESDALVIEVSPRQFQWDVRYAGADGKFNTPDDITTINQVHAPVNTNVLVKLSAQDVIHSFFVPEFRIKQDAVPGMLTLSWFNSQKTGEYEIACAELCGLGHYRMKGFLTIHSQEEFDKWYSKQVSDKAAELAPAAQTPADTSTVAATPPPAATDTASTAAPSAPTADTSAGK